jgi:hypothetical protein
MTSITVTSTVGRVGNAAQLFSSMSMLFFITLVVVLTTGWSIWQYQTNSSSESFIIYLFYSGMELG